MDLTFEEKSTWGSLLLICLVYGAYGFDLLTRSEPASLSDMLVTMLGIVLILVVVEVVFHIFLAALHRPEMRDERAQLIGARSASFGFYTIAAGVMVLLFSILINGALAEQGEDVFVFSTYWVANSLLLTMIVAEIVHYGSMLVMYRRGV